MASSSSADPEQDPEPDEPIFRFDQNNTSSHSLISHGGSGYESQYGSVFGSRFSLTDGSGFFISSLALTIIVSAIAVVGIVLVAVIITLSVLLASCGENSVNLQLEGSADICSSFRLNVELNNIQGRALPATCDTELFKYVNGGQYTKDVELAVTSARSYLKSLGLEGNQSFGVVLDIDETALSTAHLYQNAGYRSRGILDQRLGLWVNGAKTIPMLPVLDLYHEVRAANWSIFFVSERPESALAVTVQNLLDSGYEGWHGLYLRSAGDSESTVQAFKSKKRMEIEKQGYQILCVIGDQWSDIIGPATGNHIFKLPNPMYQIP